MKRSVIGRSLACLAASMIAAVCAVAAHAEPERVNPQVPGLYKRIVSKPGAEIRKEPAGASLSKPPPFETYYVFGSRKQGNKTWVSIGPTAAGKATGWIDRDQAIDITHLLVLCPASRQGRDRSLFFKDMASLAKIAKDSSRVEAHRRLLQQAAKDEAHASAGVVGVEPQNVADCIDAFTFMPIRTAVEGSEANIRGVGNSRFFETLSVPLPPKASGEGSFRGGVVFVIDTSISMGPYIEQTRKAVARLSSQIRNSEAGKRVSFGIVAYRDSRKASAVSEYVARIVHPLEETFQPAAFDAKLKALKESTASNKDFREDAVAGLAEAFNMPGWEKFQARYVILITDAGMRDSDDPLSETALSLDATASEARTKRIALYSLFLKTDAGKAEHAQAMTQHRRVTREENSQQRVLPVTGGSVEEFGAGLDKVMATLAEALTKGVDQAQRELNADCGETRRLSEMDRMLCDIDATTQAMRIEWLGRRAGATPPSVVNGWVSDFSLDSKDSVSRAVAYRPFLLLTRDQMDTLVNVWEPMSKVAGRDIDTNREKIARIFQTAIAQGAVDPGALRSTGPPGGNTFRVSDAEDLGKLLPGWINELPLKSPFMRLKVADWASVSQQQDSRESVEKAVIAFKRWMLDRRRGWVKLAPGAGPDEEVYAVPWDLIP